MDALGGLGGLEGGRDDRGRVGQLRAGGTATTRGSEDRQAGGEQDGGKSASHEAPRHGIGGRAVDVGAKGLPSTRALSNVAGGLVREVPVVRAPSRR